jgi:flagellar biogenesis protein FliO
MDTNLETPPAPFPWLETQDPMRLQLFLIIYQIILLIFMLVRMILNRNNTLRQQAKPHVPSHQ